METNSNIFLLLTAIAALGRFAAFALSPKVIGVRKDETPNKLIGVPDLDERPRTGFVTLSVNVLQRYIVANFGTRYFSPAKFWRVAAMSAFIVLGVFVTSHAVSETAWRMPSDDTASLAWPWYVRVGGIAMCLIALVFVNTVADTVAISVVRHLIDPCATLPLDEQAQKKMAWRLAFLPLYGLVIYFLFTTTMNAAFSAIITIRGVMAGYPLMGSLDQFFDVQWQIFLNETVPRFIDPVGRGKSIMVGESNLLYFCFTPLLPAALLGITVAAGFLLELVDQISNGQVSAALPAEERQKRNPLFVTAIVLSMFGAIATLIMAAL